MYYKLYRVSSDCMHLHYKDERRHYGYCEILKESAFKEYVFRGQCGTAECPFYKQKKLEVKQKDPGNWVPCMR